MPTRVRIVQPLIPKYREPLFAALARVPDFELEVWADLAPSGRSLKGAAGSTAFRCVQADYRERGPFLWQPAMRRAVRDGADVVILPWNTRYAHLLPSLLAARRRRVGTILWGHGIGKRETPLRRRVRNSFLRRADAAIVYSPGIADTLASEGIERAKLFVAPNSVDQAPIAAATRSWPAERVAAFLAERGLVPQRHLLYVARLEPEKRLDRAIRTLPSLSRDLSLVVVGDGPERTPLEALASSLGVRDRVRFEGAIYDEMALAPWMLGAALLVHPGAIGLSLLHAFGYGLPVVTSDDRLPHGPEIEALADGENSLLYRDGDLADLAAKIARIADDSTLRARLSANARATVERPDGWNLGAMVEGFRAAIRTVVEARRTSAS
jgi:glycosyltransferase involved in cell wall biosynthesis